MCFRISAVLRLVVPPGRGGWNLEMTKRVVQPWLSQIWMSRVTHMNESCHTYGWVMLHMSIIDVIHMNVFCQVNYFFSIIWHDMSNAIVRMGWACAHIHTHTRKQAQIILRTHTHTRTHAHMHTRAHAHTHTHTHTCTHTHSHVRAIVCVCERERRRM